MKVKERRRVRSIIGIKRSSKGGVGGSDGSSSGIIINVVVIDVIIIIVFLLKYIICLFIFCDCFFGFDLFFFV